MLIAPVRGWLRPPVANRHDGFGSRFEVGVDAGRQTSVGSEDGLLAGMWSPVETVVDPREVVASLPEWLSRVHGVRFAFGTGPGLIDRLGGLKQELGVNGIAAELNPGGLLTPDQEMRSLRILLNEVAASFK